MTKQEMAEWLAENVLGAKKCGSTRADEMGIMGWKIKDLFYREKDGLEYFIYSPDGFFAVWDAVEKEEDFWSVNFLLVRSGVQCDLDIGRHHVGDGIDRYKAFYNAVYEAMKGDKE